MANFWSPDADLFVWIIPPDGGLVLERGRDDGQGNLSLSQGAKIRRTRVLARGRHEDLTRPYFTALTCDLPAGLVAAAHGYIGKRIPDWLMAEMRLHLEDRVRTGRFILAGKRAPIAADAPWHRFDPASLAAWDFRMDNTAVPTLGGGDTYVLVTAFTPEQWRAITAPEATPGTQCSGEAPPHRTGAPGRPSSMHLVKREHTRRLGASEAEATVRAEAACLADWLRRTHPCAPPLTTKTVENGIRDRHRRHKEEAPK